MLQQAARQVRQQVARISAKNAAQSRNAATSLTLVRAPAAAPAAAFHSAAPLSVTASAQRDGHSSSSSPSGASAGSSLALLGALVGSVGGVWVMRSNEVAAESAAAGMPDVSASAVSAPSDASSPLDGPPRRKKKKGTKKRVGEGPRPWLPNAGKLSGFHSGITEITNVHTWQGFLFMWNSQAWPQMDTFPTKQCVVQIQGNIGGAHGNTGHLVFQTNLGQNHSLDAIVDTSGGLQGSYTLMAFDNKLSIKPSFQIHPNGNGGDLTVDWRAKEWSANFALSPMQGDLSLSVTHPLTYYLAMGTELHLTPFNAAPAHLNGGLKYKHGLDQFSVSKKDASYQASYCREIFRESNLFGKFDEFNRKRPEATSELGADLRINPTAGKAEVSVGIKHIRHTGYIYQAALSTEPRVDVTVEMDPLPNAPMRMALAASVPYTGKAEDLATFAVSMTVQL